MGKPIGEKPPQTQQRRPRSLGQLSTATEKQPSFPASSPKHSRPSPHLSIVPLLSQPCCSTAALFSTTKPAEQTTTAAAPSSPGSQQRRPHQGASSAVIGTEQQPTHGSAGATLFVISFNRSAAALLQQRHPQTHGLPLQPKTPFLLSPLTGQPPSSPPQLQQPRTTVAVRSSIGRREPNREGRRQRNGTDLRRKTKADPKKTKERKIKINWLLGFCC